MNTQVTLHSAGGETAVADAVLAPASDWNNITRGGQVSLTVVDLRPLFVVSAGESETIASGTTGQYTDVIVDGTLTVDGTLQVADLVVNGTLDVNGTVDVDEQYAPEFEQFKEYREFAGQYNVRETLDGTQRFSETIDSSLSTLVIGVEPSQDLQDESIPGCWGVVDGISDARNAPLANSRITIDLRVLATYSDYNDISAVTTDLRI